MNDSREVEAAAEQTERADDGPPGAGGEPGTGAESTGPESSSGDADGRVEAAETADGESADESREVEELRAELDALNDRHLRLAAEFDNFRKRNARERSQITDRSQAELIASLLEALDDLQRVTDQDVAAASVESLLEGVELVHRKLLTVLRNAGLEPIDAEGAPFDPNTMEGLMTVPTADPDEDEVVADVFQKGYRFKDILVRPARVRVKAYDPDAETADGS